MRIPDLAQLAEHLTVVVYSISKGHLFESGIPDIIYNNKNYYKFISL